VLGNYEQADYMRWVFQDTAHAASLMLKCCGESVPALQPLAEAATARFNLFFSKHQGRHSRGRGSNARQRDCRRLLGSTSQTSSRHCSQQWR
jgi:hypothetical protein